MTTHSNHISNAEDAAFDATMKIGGIVVALLAIIGVAIWYFVA